ncbi:hypothetical protein Tco_0265833 [Tanacetum coccineum]
MRTSPVSNRAVLLKMSTLEFGVIPVSSEFCVVRFDQLTLEYSNSSRGGTFFILEALLISDHSPPHEPQGNYLPEIRKELILVVKLKLQIFNLMNLTTGRELMDFHLFSNMHFERQQHVACHNCQRFDLSVDEKDAHKVDFRLSLTASHRKEHFPLPFMDLTCSRDSHRRRHSPANTERLLTAAVPLAYAMHQGTTFVAYGDATATMAIGAVLWGNESLRKHFKAYTLLQAKTMTEAESTTLTTEKGNVLAVTPQGRGRYQKLQLNELNELRDQAYENSLIYKERTKKLHESKIKNRIFNVGDQVLLFNSRLKIFSGKLKTRWLRRSQKQFAKERKMIELSIEWDALQGISWNLKSSCM